MKASVVLTGAQKLLQDNGSSRRWPDTELVGYLNRAQRAVVNVRPDAKATRGEITLEAGVDQAIPAAGLRLIRLLRNSGGRVISLVSEEQLSDFDPSWPAAAAKSVIKHYMHDPLLPKAFQVYPPAAAGTKVLGMWAVAPTDCADGNADIDLDDIYEPVLTHLVCFYAYLRDSEDASNATLAAAHRDTAMLLLTGKQQADDAAEPRASQPNKLNPNLR